MITIQPPLKLATIQKEFNEAFPYLKLEFFKHKHNMYAGNTRKDMLLPVEAFKHVIKENEKMSIDEEMPVFILEQQFREKFGVAVQVFRKSGRSWLETTKTDDWTLKRQNDQGMELSYLNK